MAFENVNAGNYIKGTGMEVGASYTGYPIKFVKSTQYEQTNIVMKNAETGEKETFLTAGNLKYFINDGKIELGVLTRITRLADKLIKGKKSTQFLVEQDSSDTLSDNEFDKIESAVTSTPTVNTKTLAAEKVKREAASLAASATKAK
jgi:hypothetical protein